MTDTAAAILILPTMLALVIVLEGSRMCCGRLLKQIRLRRSLAGASAATRTSRVAAD